MRSVAIRIRLRHRLFSVRHRPSISWLRMIIPVLAIIRMVVPPKNKNRTTTNRTKQNSESCNPLHFFHMRQTFVARNLRRNPKAANRFLAAENS